MDIDILRHWPSGTAIRQTWFGGEPGPVSQLGGARKRSQPDVAHLSVDPQDESWDTMPNSYC